ncbi:MAG: MFS transporter [Cellvibrionaceae bacterium]
MSSLSLSETRSVASLAALYIVRMLGLFMVLPVLALSGSEYTDSSVFLLGVALGVYGLTQACLQIPFGMLSDRYGRKPLIAIGLIIFALGSIVAASAETVYGLIIGRALQGAGAIAGVVMAMVGDLTSDENRTKAMATIGASIGVAFALSLVIGPAVSGFGGVRWIFWLTLLLSVIGIIILIWGVPALPREKLTPVLPSESIESVLLNADLWRLNFGIFILHAVLMGLFLVVPVLLESVDIPQLHHSWVYLGVMGSSFCLMVPLIIIGERKHKVKGVFLSLILLAALALVGLSFFASDVMFILIAMLLFFIGFNYLEATLPSLMSKTVSSAQRGAGSGLFSTCQFLGAATGGIAGGWLITSFGVPTLLMVCSGALMLWWLLAWTMVVPKRIHVAAENVVA